MKLSPLALLPFLAAFVAADDVLEIGQKEFDKTVADGLSLVAFTAPWCGHCKALAPQYAEAATVLKNQSIKLAKVDCTAEEELCKAYNVGGYPTLKVFRNGEATDYNGPRKKDGIVSYMRKQALPAVSDVTTSNHDEFKASDRIVLVAYLSSSDVTNKHVFTTFANKHRDDFLFGLATDDSVSSTAGVSAPSVVLYKQFDDGRADLSGALSAEKLDAFVKENQIPLLDEITPENFALYAESDLPLAYTFVETADKGREALVKSLNSVAKEVKGKVNMVWIDATKFADHAKSLNLMEAKWPSFAIQNIKEQLKYPLEQTKTVDAASVGAFLKDFLAGKILPSVKSEPIPTSQDEPTFHLVSDEFEKVVYDDSKDVFIAFVAPWCGHCKRLKPTWDILGERFNASKDKLVIAKFDATANDIPASAGFRVSGFPTLKFKPAGGRSFIDYSGDRSIEDLVEFVESNSTNDLTAAPAAAASGESAPASTPAAAAGKDKHDEL